MLKVGYTSIRHAERNDRTTYYSRCPSIKLKGNWLEDAGFTAGATVTVTAEYGQLINRPLTKCRIKKPPD
ncbi:SymE family type I addiction module toxin [uncultured Pluralibacter sp.]|uniref:SymE family type I addiction module toxin n=1 Tax=uncultured Pluralibacter sp. TaxID=1490864 RepID=UPI00262ADA82|nr:SymE family type I addiction module toxin [uncultured Pluralibacter sp.]